MVIRKHQSGFALISVVLVILIALVMLGLYFGRSSKRQTPAQTQKNAAEGVRKANDSLNQYQQQMDIQNDVNGIQ